MVHSAQKIRLIPVVLLRNGIVVQSKLFKRFQALGNPSTIVSRFSNWYSDELIYLDISRGSAFSNSRRDLKYSVHSEIMPILAEVAQKCFMPLTFGGGIRTIDDMSERFHLGADKITLNSQAFHNPPLITEGAKAFGSQAIVVSIDVKRSEDGEYEVFVDGGKTPTKMSPVDFARQAEDRGSGEILLNSIDQDGLGQGYDLDLIEAVSKSVRIPVIALGGVGKWEHFVEGIKAGASAVAAANIFQYTENSVFNAKKYLCDSGLNFRKPKVESIMDE